MGPFDQSGSGRLGVTVYTATAWKSNAELFEAVASFGYLDGRVADVTYGYGIFWQNWQPKELVACDLDAEKSPIGYSVDFCNTPFENNEFDSVVIDGPYKMNGRTTLAVDERYGVHVPSTWQARIQLIRDGMTECARIVKKKGFVAVKCQDQVVSGAKRFQTMEFANHGATVGLTLVDRFDMLGTPRPQPEGRREMHSRQNYSTLLILQKSP